jgi:DNA helicase-2/ATP-dependent DNA helicase PcrA
MSVTQISSDTLLDDIEQHFRVSAGPGAGKTYWLIGHIKNVLHNSNRLAKSKKIACITYTNIAVETILSRLGTSSENVEVSTIHSFLYKHIVKPYISFISEEYGINISEMDGHDESYISLKNLVTWIESHTNSAQLRHPYTINQLTKLENNKVALSNWLNSLSYKIDQTGTINIVSDRLKAFYIDNRSRRFLGRQCMDLLDCDFLSYKRLYWQDGKIDHDDVLFFSYQIIKKYPFTLDVLRSKFPYFFVDEFQDSNPIQVELLKLIGEKETIIGIIGDKAQSIYGFQGADPSQFQLFSLTRILDYQISNNRRSSNEIISLLNNLRFDIIQNPIRNFSSIHPTILIGEMSSALDKAQILCGKEIIYSLARQNVISNAMKMAIGGIELNGKLFDELKAVDSNKTRCNLIIYCIKSIEFARENKFKDSIKELERFFKYGNDKEKTKKISLNHIIKLSENYDEFKKGSLLEFSEFVRNNIKKDLSKVSGGAIKIFYENHTYQQLALCVNVPEDLSCHKTIHKSKGDEFDNVLLVLKNESDLSFILSPNIDNNEEHRINYVAVSRAKNKLFISIPSLTPIVKRKLELKLFQIVDV